jgi:EmrB/QacA subfamily drug resistance transporter
VTSRKTHRPLVLAAMVLAAAMGAIEGTIIATAMPSIAAEIGGFSLYSWVFSSFLLMQAVSIPIFGKISDLLGRKPAFIAGVVVFLTGSVLCGFAPSMGALVAFRFIQGIGAGAVQPITTTLAGDLYSLEERGRVQGYLSSVWGISSIAGPLVGGLIVHTVGWQWIFWMNVPFGLAAIFFISRYLHEDVRHGERNVDYPGAALLLAALGPLMLALTQAGVWGLPAAGGLLALAAVGFALFVRRERRAPDPLMHLELWSEPLIRNANVATLVLGIMMIGIITFLPTFVQGVLRQSALVAGFTLSVMTVGWPLSSFAAGHLLVRFGVRRLVRLGGVVALASTATIAALAAYGPVGMGVGSFGLGVGLGLLNTTFVVAIQASVPWNQRGVATASNMLMRIVGNALGAALFGGVVNLRMNRYLAGTGLSGRVSVDNIQELMGSGAAHGPALDAGELSVLRAGLSQSLHLVFWGIVLLAAGTLYAAWRVPELERADETFDASHELGV